MANIAFDTAKSARDLGHASASLTQAITIAQAGELVVAFGWENGATGSWSATFAGNAMTEIPTVSPIDQAGSRMRGYYYYNPPTGSQNCVITYSASNLDHYISVAAYKNVSSVQLDAAFSHAVNNSSQTSTLTTIKDKAWTVMGVIAGSGSLAASTGSTLRDSVIGTVWGIFDSNAVITPAGSTSMTTTNSSGNTSAIMVSIAPGDVSVSVTDSTTTSDVTTVFKGILLSVSDTFSGLIDAVRARFGWSNITRSSSSWSNQSESSSSWTNQQQS